MVSINVSYEELNSAVSSIESSRDNIYNELDALRNRIQELTTSGFVTEKTSGAFNEAYNNYSEGAKKTVQGMDDVIAFLKKVEETLRETDAALASSLG
jgi:WXG100 family type VII secretion target